jgi:hypothetical protein
MLWGLILYRICAIVSGLIVMLAILNFAYNVDDGRPLIPVAALGFAAIIWLIGACCRYLFGSSEIRDPVRHI